MLLEILRQKNQLRLVVNIDEFWISHDLWSNLPGGWHQISEQFSAQCPQISQTKVLPKSTAPIWVRICVYFRMTSTSSQKLDS